ncbi:ribosomal L27 protein-domain-containing protein [Clohesyomyces aquaticus]|uniref:Large ribosomal subunit protein bL27m n=1 Tax=Clohesyomyces aquaticus TaxID=1231657 RepID=A0A1Y2A9H0_9PLEO|nr:ribosomal L27 protein-domain-containing protein [Clohesyomyces aquaticus]
MLLPRIFAPARACIKRSSAFFLPSCRAGDVLRAVNGSSARPQPTHIISSIRHASHQSQGRANGAKQGPGKRLGAKKSGGEYVIPGNIIFRQRGTGWFPGENCAMGRDHCIYATASGYVRYYRDPIKHPKRQYIGVVFEKHEQLPYPQNAARRRRLGMLAVVHGEEPQMMEGQTIVNDLQVGDGTGSETSIAAVPTDNRSSGVVLGKSGYAFRMSNWEIGRAAEKANVQVKKFVPGDRWTAWQRSRARIEANQEKKRLRGAGKKPSKPKKKR